MAKRKLLLLFAAFLVGVVTAQKAKSPWLTLSGDAPKVVARGGFSGLFPDSSYNAYVITYSVSTPDTISLCDVQLTKDGVGICLPTMFLENSTNIQSNKPDGQNTYNVDGVNMTGWFSVDFDFNSLSTLAGKPLVITHNGASGVYPDCTNLAYKLAVDDGADIIDCPVQITEDGTLICMSSTNLMDTTTVTSSPFSTKTTTIPELQSAPGIFTFNFTWDDIQKNLKPAIASPFTKYRLVRNPKYKNAGSFMKLSDFLAFAKANTVSGILITIENAAFFAEKLGVSITDGVIKALKEAGYSNQTTQDVMIQSTNSSVLNKFKQQTGYKLVYNVDESISSADKSSISNIKKFATHVAVRKTSVFPVSLAFITTQTDLVPTLQKAGLTVLVYVLSNEFVSQPWDFFADPTVEINTYYQGAGVDGVVTDFPGTAVRYRRNSCLKMKDAPIYMAPVQPGGLLSATPPAAVPALPPYPVLDAADVVEPPLPSALKPSNSTPPSPPSAQPSSSVLSASFSRALMVGVMCGLLF